MTLDEWIALTNQERNRRRRRWHSRQGYWIALIDEAHRRFQREFGQHPLVNYVSYALAFGERHEPEIVVITALRPPQILEDLPDRYCTFRVTQRPNEARKQRFLSFWVLVLGKLIRWPKSKVHNWARKHHSEIINGVGSFADHREPVYYITPLLIPQRLRDRLSPQAQCELQRQLESAIQAWDCETVDFKYDPMTPGYDWAAAKARIRKILSKYESRP